MKNIVIDMHPKNSVYTTFKFREYKIYKAISEYIDNSTQSFFDHKNELGKLKIEINYTNDEIIIKDNAYGIKIESLPEALQLGDHPKFDSGRNQFGMGLKVASIWFTDEWQVISKRMGEELESTITVKMSELIEGINPVIKTKKVPKDSHYTTIKLLKLSKRRITGKSVASLKSLLASVYKYDILNGDIEILLNGDLLKAKEDEFYSSEEYNEEVKKDIDISFDFEGKTYSVNGFIGVRKKGSTLTTDGGFSLMDNNRVIIPNWRSEDIFGRSNSFTYQRLVGDLNLNGFNVTSDKQDFDWDNGLKDAFIEALLIETQPYSKIANEIRTRKTEVFTPKEKEALVEEVAQPLEINSSNELPKATYDPEVNKSEDVIEIIGKSIKIDSITYSIDIQVRDSDKIDFIKINKKARNKIEIIFNRNHVFLKPKINNKEDLINYLNLMSGLVVAAEHTKIISSYTDESGEVFINSDDLFELLNKVLVGYNE